MDDADKRLGTGVKSTRHRIWKRTGSVLMIFCHLHIKSDRLAISDLTADNSPSKKIASAFSFLYGLFTVLFSICFFLYFKGDINKIITLGSLFFCIMTLVSFFGYMFFPLSQAGFAGTFKDKMHMVVTAFVVVLTIMSLILFSIGFLKTSNFKYLGIISICTFAALLIGVILINKLPKEYFGIAERVNVYSIIIFTGILSLWMFMIVKNG